MLSNPMIWLVLWSSVLALGISRIRLVRNILVRVTIIETGIPSGVRSISSNQADKEEHIYSNNGTLWKQKRASIQIRT